MNARQKAKKLKKELAELKADKTNGYKWLKIDDAECKTEDEYNPFCEIPKILLRKKVIITCGQTKLVGEIVNDGDLIIVDSKKLDKAYDEARERMKK